jgi:hypothetical protein
VLPTTFENDNPGTVGTLGTVIGTRDKYNNKTLGEKQTELVINPEYKEDNR